MRFFSNAVNGTPEKSGYAKNIQELVQRIAAEMCNICYGVTYFDTNGVLLTKPIPGHNTYTIDSVEYEISPNIGVVHVLVNERIYGDLMSRIDTAFKTYISILDNTTSARIPSAFEGTTQYFVSDIVNDEFKKEIKVYQNTGVLSPDRQASFTWFIGGSRWPISGFTENPLAIYSLSSIVVDLYGIIDLPDGYKHPDYPHYTNCVAFKQKQFIPDLIDFSYYTGLHGEIIKHYNLTQNFNIPRGKAIVLKPIPPEYSPAKVVKWEWLTPYTIPDTAVMSYKEHIDKGLFDTNPSDEPTYKCFVTGAPLFEDIYVFDIISQDIIEEVDETKVDEFLITHYKAVLVDETDEKKEKTKSGSKDKSKSKGKSARNSGDYDSYDEEPETKAVSVSTAIATKSKAKVKPVIRSAIKSNVILRGAKAKPKINYVKVAYTKKYDTPKCVLISPYYVHMSGLINAIRTFETETKTNVMVYRTYCPVTCESVIENSNAPDNIKLVMKQLYMCAKDTSAGIIADDVILSRYTGAETIDVVWVATDKKIAFSRSIYQ